MRWVTGLNAASATYMLYVDRSQVAAMEKVQVFLREDQKAALRALAARSGRRQSELIRRGVDMVLEQAEREKADWRDTVRAVAGIWRDRDDIDELMRENRAAANRRLDAMLSRK